MSAGSAPAGIRRRLSGEASEGSASVVFVDPGGYPVEVGDWVVVAGPEGDWAGEIVVAPAQVVESALVGPLPRIIRLARADERPSTTRHVAGTALLDRLGLPQEALERPKRAQGS